MRLTFTSCYIYLSACYSEKNLINKLWVYSNVGINSLVQLDFFIYILFTVSLAGLLCIDTFRKKFIYFFLLLVAAWIFGTTYSSDGLILMLILTECCVILIFLLAYLILQFRVSNIHQSSNSYKLFISILIIMYILSPQGNSLFTSTPVFYIYNYTNQLVSSDFFILFYTLYYASIVNIYLLALLLGLFSIFFIYVYLLLKKLHLIKVKTLNKIYILRKQHLTHQARYKTMLYNFQK